MSIDTHICLISHQPLPNLIPLMDPAIRPRRVILLISKDMNEKAEWFATAVPSEIQVRHHPVADPWDVESVQNEVLLLLEKERESVEQGRLVLNATGGTKPMTLAVYEACRIYGIPIFFVHPERDRVIWLYPEDRPAHELANRIRLEPFLSAHGATVEGRLNRSVPFAERLELAAGIVHRIEHYQHAIGALNGLAASAERTLRSRSLRNGRGNLQKLIQHFAGYGLLRYEEGRLVFPNEEARFFVNGGWLEYHIFDAVRRLRERNSRIQDIAWGIQIRRHRRGRAISNELDVAFLCDNRLHLIECKTRKFAGEGEDTPGAEALYKLETLADLIGGLEARAMLVSYRDIRPGLRARAADMDVTVCAGHQLRNLQSVLVDFIA